MKYLRKLWVFVGFWIYKGMWLWNTYFWREVKNKPTVIAGDGGETLDRQWEVESLGDGAWEWVRQRPCDYVSYEIESEW